MTILGPHYIDEALGFTETADEKATVVAELPKEGQS